MKVVVVKKSKGHIGFNEAYFQDQKGRRIG